MADSSIKVRHLFLKNVGNNNARPAVREKVPDLNRTISHTFEVLGQVKMDVYRVVERDGRYEVDQKPVAKNVTRYVCRKREFFIAKFHGSSGETFHWITPSGRIPYRLGDRGYLWGTWPSPIEVNKELGEAVIHFLTLMDPPKTRSIPLPKGNATEAILSPGQVPGRFVITFVFL